MGQPGTVTLHFCITVLLVLGNRSEYWVQCLVFLQVTELRFTVIIKLMFSKPVKMEKSSVTLLTR